MCTSCKVYQLSCWKEEEYASKVSAGGIVEENPELQCQIGIMKGILQMFDRQHLPSRRRLNGQSNRKTVADRNSLGEDIEECSPKIVLETNLSRNLNENQLTAKESSRTSSSSCSSFSSLDFTRSRQEESPFVDRERSKMDLPDSKNHDGDAHRKPQYRKSLDFRDVIKDSIYKDTTHAFSVATSPRVEDWKNNNKEKHHKDSPRPLPKSTDASSHTFPRIDGKSKMHVDFGESLGVLLKLEQTPNYFSETNEPPRRSYEARKTSRYQVPKEPSRFSYDGRDPRYHCMDSQESRRISCKLRELPRLSLDRRECSLRSFDFDSKQSTAARKQVDRSTISCISQQEPASCKRLQSVVAKLMGLEAMPSLSQDQLVVDNANTNSNTLSTINICRDGNLAATRTMCNKEDHLSLSTKCYSKESVTPQQRRPEHSVAKSISSSKLLSEPAPWRHHSTKKQDESVCSIIEKRLKGVEFQQFNKDLRALKHILDAMHAKVPLQTDKSQSQPSRANLFHNTQPTSGENLGLTDPQNQNIRRSALAKRDQTPRVFESPFVIMKPARSFNSPSLELPSESLPPLQRLLANNPRDKKKASSVNMKIRKDQAPKSIYKDPTSQNLLSSNNKCRKVDIGAHKSCSELLQVSPRSQVLEPREDNGRPDKASNNSPSPRLQLKKIEIEKRSRPPRPSSQANVQHANRYSSESVSPRIRLTQKPVQAQEIDNQMSSDTGNDTGNLNRQDDGKSFKSDGDAMLASRIDTQVKISKRFTGKAANSASTSMNVKKTPHYSKDKLSIDLAAAAVQQPSPISVLDASLHQDNLATATISSNASEDIEKEDSVKYCLLDAPSTKLSFGFNQKKLENIETLFEKLSQLSSSNGEAPTTDPIAFLCKEEQSADRRYVLEILLVSGLLMLDLKPRPINTESQLYPSGYPINPDLFRILEKTNSARHTKLKTLEDTSQLKSDQEKLHRKLVFDVVNELLVQKLKLSSPGTLLHARKARFESGQLLKELCSDIDNLKAGSFSAGGVDKSLMSCEYHLMRQPENWFESGTELETIVLEMERSIFRDLVDEVVRGREGALVFSQAMARTRQTTRC